MGITKVKALPGVISVELADIEATETEIELDAQPEIAKRKLVANDVDVYQDAFKYGRPCRLPKGQLWDLLQMRDVDNKLVFTLRRPKDYVEPETVRCLVAICPTRIPIPTLTEEQTALAAEVGVTVEQYTANVRRRLIREHMKAFHPAEMADFFPAEKDIAAPR